MTAKEKRDAVKNRYKTILNRNDYSQHSAKRQCVYHPYTDGKFYSDCSSSILNTYLEECLLAAAGGNTATIHNTWEKVDVKITDGIPDEMALRVGDALMFVGNDPSRPLQIGHVEMYVGNNTLYGHGSGTPSEKNMREYCKKRYSQKADNGARKGVVEVRRLIVDDAIAVPIEGTVCVLEDLNYRSTPDKNAKVLGTFKKGQKITVSKKCNKWFYVPEVNAWCSAKYLEGWVKEQNKWWYLLKDYNWYASTVETIDGKDYAFDKEGWNISADRIASDNSIVD